MNNVIHVETSHLTFPRDAILTHTEVIAFDPVVGRDHIDRTTVVIRIAIFTLEAMVLDPFVVELIAVIGIVLTQGLKQFVHFGLKQSKPRIGFNVHIKIMPVPGIQLR